MNQETLAPAPPSNPYWHRFADNVIGLKSLVDSYLDAGFLCSKATAYVNASKLRKKPVVAEYIRYWMDQQLQQQWAALDQRHQYACNVQLRRPFRQ